MIYGKFETAEKLFEAYQNLEKDYTRKSQELARLKGSVRSDPADGTNHAAMSELHKSAVEAERPQATLVGQPASFASSHNPDISLADCEEQSVALNKVNENDIGTIATRDAECNSNALGGCQNSTSVQLSTNETQTGTISQLSSGEELYTAGADVADAPREQESEPAKESQVPVWQRPLWHAEVRSFFESHPIAREMEKEILEELAADGSLKFASDALLRAAERTVGRAILGSNIQKLAKQIASLEAVKDTVLMDYTKQLAERHFAPPSICSSAAAPVVSGRPKFRSIREAGEELLKRL